MLYGSFADGRQDPWSDLDYFLIPFGAKEQDKNWANIEQRFQGQVHRPLNDGEEGYFIDQPGPFSQWDATPESIHMHVKEIVDSREQERIWVIGSDDARAVALQDGSSARNVSSIVDELINLPLSTTRITSSPLRNSTEV